jgi:hypothetical protein
MTIFLMVLNLEPVRCGNSCKCVVFGCGMVERRIGCVFCTGEWGKDEMRSTVSSSGKKN